MHDGDGDGTSKTETLYESCRQLRLQAEALLREVDARWPGAGPRSSAVGVVPLPSLGAGLWLIQGGACVEQRDGLPRLEQVRTCGDPLRERPTLTMIQGGRDA